MEYYLTTFFIALLAIYKPAWKLFFKSDVPKKEKIKERKLFFDYIKGISIIAVIVIHIEFILNQTHSIYSNFLYIIDALNRFALPVFFISSGILLMPESASTNKLSKFYLKKVIRIFIPYAFITLVLSVIFGFGLKEYFFGLVTGTTQVPYYFIVVLAQLYLVYPFLIKFREHKFFLPLSFLISLISFFVPKSQFVYGFPTFFVYLYFFSYGIARRNFFLNYRKSSIPKKELYFWIAISFFYLAYIFYFPGDYYNARFFYGLSIFNLLFYFKKILQKNAIINKALCFTGKLSLWIFLTHFFIIIIISKLFIANNTNFFIYMFIIFIFALAISILTSWLLDKYYMLLKKLIKLKL